MEKTGKETPDRPGLSIPAGFLPERKESAGGLLCRLGLPSLVGIHGNLTPFARQSGRMPGIATHCPATAKDSNPLVLLYLWWARLLGTPLPANSEPYHETR